MELAARGGAGDGPTETQTVPGYRWQLAHVAPAAGAAGGLGLLSLPVMGGVAAVVVLGLAGLWAVRRRAGARGAEDVEPAPVILGGAAGEAGAMSGGTEPSPSAESDAFGAVGLGRDTGILVTEEPEGAEAGVPETDFADIFEGVEDDAEPAPASAGAAAPPSLFRAYDIRGPVAGGLSAELARQVGRAAGSAAAARGEGAFVVGRDGRTSSPELAEAVVAGLVESGMDVIDLGLVPTPVVYFAGRYLDVGSCLVVTGSHNPPEDNGIKLVIAGEVLSPDDIQDLRRRIVAGDLVTGAGKVQRMEVGADYIRRISEDIPVALGNAFTVVVDCANGATSELAPRLFRALGHDVVDLYCSVDGTFPNHPPDPSDPRNLKALRAAVKEHGADLGMALDGDGDRLVVVDDRGAVIWPDRLLMVFARDLLEREPGAEIVFDVKCSRHLPRVIAAAGGRPVMGRSGHSLMKAKMAATGSPLGGEMSGHFFFKDRWYGFDDGLYAGARLLEILQAAGTSPREVFAALPRSLATPEVRVAVPEGDQHGIMESLEGATLEGAEMDRTDGLRAEYPDGFGLVRASNTTPSLVFRFEGDDEAAVRRIQAAFKDLVGTARPDLKLPF